MEQALGGEGHLAILAVLALVNTPLFAFLLWYVRGLATRFEELVASDHVHRPEFNQLNQKVERLSEQLANLRGRLRLDGRVDDP